MFEDVHTTPHPTEPAADPMRSADNPYLTWEVPAIESALMYVQQELDRIHAQLADPERLRNVAWRTSEERLVWQTRAESARDHRIARLAELRFALTTRTHAEARRLAELAAENENLRRRVEAVDRLTAQRDALRVENAQLREENEAQREAVRALQAEMRRLRKIPVARSVAEGVRRLRELDGELVARFDATTDHGERGRLAEERKEVEACLAVLLGQGTAHARAERQRYYEALLRGEVAVLHEAERAAFLRVAATQVSGAVRAAWNADRLAHGKVPARAEDELHEVNHG